METFFAIVVMVYRVCMLLKVKCENACGGRTLPFVMQASPDIVQGDDTYLGYRKPICGVSHALQFEY